jgi:VanZ family protein
MSSPISAALLILAAVAVLLLAPIGLGPREYAGTIQDLLHAPLFAVIAIALRGVLAQRLPRGPAYLFSFAGAVAVGIASEVAQSFTASRHPELVDVAIDAAGAAGGLCWHAARDKTLRLSRRRKRGLRAVVALVAVLLFIPLARTGMHYLQLRWQLPELATWRSTLGYHFAQGINAEIVTMVVPLQWSKTGEAALHVTPTGVGRYGGVGLDETWPDWSDYSGLEIELINPNSRDLELTLRVEDELHDNDYSDRYNRSFVVPAGQRMTMSVAIDDIRHAPAARQMEMDRIRRVVLFQDIQRGQLAHYVCKIRLTP